MIAVTDHSNSDGDRFDDEFERRGRRAGAELRLPPPADGPGSILRTAHRRQVVVTSVAAGVTVALVVTGLLVASSRRQDDPVPIATMPPTPATVATTTSPSVPDDTAPPDGAPAGTPGTWRAVADPSSLAPELPAAAVWTGTEVIIVGSHVNNAELAPPSAVAYDVGQDLWRALADPPPALSKESPGALAPGMQWTGTEVLAATSQGEVYSYDPVQDVWSTRASADESMSLPAADALVAVSAQGVLTRSSTGWWWYDNATDRWESVAAPSDGDGYSTLETLDGDRIVGARIDGATITAAVFEIASRSWRIGPTVEDGPVSNRNDAPTTCDANDGLLVCWAEGFGTLDGVVIDPLIGLLDRFALGSHSNSISTSGLPWMAHAWKLLSPRTATWEDLPPSPDSRVDGFSAAVWTGSEIVFLGGSDIATGELLGATAAYTPLRLPGQ